MHLPELHAQSTQSYKPCIVAASWIAMTVVAKLLAVLLLVVVQSLFITESLI